MKLFGSTNKMLKTKCKVLHQEVLKFVSKACSLAIVSVPGY